MNMFTCTHTAPRTTCNYPMIGKNGWYLRLVIFILCGNVCRYSSHKHIFYNVVYYLDVEYISTKINTISYEIKEKYSLGIIIIIIKIKAENSFIMVEEDSS